MRWLLTSMLLMSLVERSLSFPSCACAFALPIELFVRPRTWGSRSMSHTDQKPLHVPRLQALHQALKVTASSAADGLPEVSLELEVEGMPGEGEPEVQLHGQNVDAHAWHPCRWP